ncbi:hypothetical protein BH23PAT1_BH23PAT1_0190 [soil metagenome]
MPVRGADGTHYGWAWYFRDVSDSKHNEETLKKQNYYLETLQETALALGKRLDPLSVLKTILKQAGKLANTEDGYIYLASEDDSFMEVQVGTGIFEGHIGKQIKKGEGLAGKVWRSEKHITIDDYDSWRGRITTFPKGVFRAGVGIPLKSDERITGVIALAYRQKHRTFQPEQVSARTGLAELASIALDNAKLYQKSQEEIAERIKAESEASASRERLRFMAESMPQKIFTASHEGKIDYFNPQWMKYTGLSFNEIKGWGWTQFIHPDDIDENIRRWEHSIETGELFELEHRFRRHDGQFRWHVSRAHAQRDKNGRIIMWIGSNTDIEDVKQTMSRTHELEQITATLREQRSQLIALNQAKDDFISLASHQLRTPATGVKQFLGMLKDGYAGQVTGDQTELVNYAYESNERQINIIDDLLKVAQLDAGKVSLKKEKGNLLSLIKDVLHEHTPTFIDRNQKIVFKCRQSTLAVPMDKDRIRMVIDNIIDNASKYSPPGKTIEVKLQKLNSNSIVISIKDEGVGIASKDLDKIFYKFSRIDNPLSVAVGGSGLGLYWVKKIIDLHEGSIEVSSQINKGTLFTITLPL